MYGDSRNRQESEDFFLCLAIPGVSDGSCGSRFDFNESTSTFL